MRTMLPLLLALLLLGARPASAKLTSIAPPPATALAAAPPDTAAALHHLFERKRKLRRKLVLSTTGAGVLLGGLLVIGGSQSNDGLGRGLAYVFAVLYGFIAGIIVLTFLLVFDRYSRLHERRALNWLRYHTLPPDLVRELQPQDFEAPPAP